MIGRVLPYLMSFAVPLVIALVLTPVVREINRRLGIVDCPDARRINTKPIPRGGGVAVFIAIIGGYLCVQLTMGFSPMGAVPPVRFYRLCALAFGMTALGFADDRFSLSPKLKLVGQVVLAFLTWWWADFGFADVWPMLPQWMEGVLTVLWIVGAVNAFNLIDGLDGLACGLALIATVGMAGALLIIHSPMTIVFYLAVIGGLLGFLRYNFNPASVFLGDSGSMFIGYLIAVLPIVSRATNSFLVSVGVPLLAMGVPIFDTSLAIVRRSVRRFLYRFEETTVAAGDSDSVMTADHDHLHHRILRSVGLNQRRAALLLYAFATLLVMFGLLGMILKSRSAGLWLAAVAIISVIIIRDMARVEIFDVGRLLNRVIHSPTAIMRRRIARLAVPTYLFLDLASLVAVFFVARMSVSLPLTRDIVRVALPLRVFSIFFFLVIFHTYSTVWSRAMPSNYVRLFMACLSGSVVAAVILYYAPGNYHGHLRIFSVLFVSLSFLALMGVRVLRPVVRDLFYAIDCSQLCSRKDVSRVLVYGAGLRYRAFRRCLVRTAASNNRIVVGLLDDDITLRGQMIGGIRILGTFADVAEVVNRMNVDTVVVACQPTEKRFRMIAARLAEIGVRARLFEFSERDFTVKPEDGDVVGDKGQITGRDA